MLRLGITPETVRELLRRSHRGWVAEQEHRIVGSTMGNRQTGKRWVIAVLPEFENRGIGNHLMALVEAWLWSAGLPETGLTTDPDDAFRAVGFYRRLGWRDWKFEY
jgi:ribosomal protein S18 acetylase RimI-like enzyme